MLGIANAAAMGMWIAIAKITLLEGKDIRDERVQWAFLLAQGYGVAEVCAIGLKRHVLSGDWRLEVFMQTGLGICICLFRILTVLVTFTALPDARHAWLRRYLLTGWAFADIAKYAALIIEMRAVQVLRRVVSAVLFPVVSSGEVYGIVQAQERLQSPIWWVMALQGLVTVVSLLPGTAYFGHAAWKGLTRKEKDAKGKKEEKKEQ